MLLKQTTVVPSAEEIQLEKARAVVVFNGDLKNLETELAVLQKEHTKRVGFQKDAAGNNLVDDKGNPIPAERFSAVITIAPLYEGMEQERVMRTRKLKDDNGNVRKNPDGTEQTEEYESKRRFIDTSKISLSRLGFAIEEGRPFYVAMSLFDTPARSVANQNSENESDDETDDEPSE